MPLEILEGEAPPPPPLGSLPLEKYILSQWDSVRPAPAGAYPAPISETPSERRTRLIRQFLELGSQGREPYNTQSQSEKESRPTLAQIDTILRPLRPEQLRPYADYTGSLDEGLYLRLCYDDSKEEAHKAVWAGNLDVAFVGPDGIILDDREIFGQCSSFSDALGVFPERVTNGGGVGHVQARERALREALSQEQGEEDEGQGDEGEGGNLVRYAAYHAACVVTHLFVEDEEALNGTGLLHIFLDDCGNVVRQWRTDNEGGDYDFDGTWKEGVWREDFYAGRGELGPAYRAGGIRGPPYSVLG
ncbi:predicted protein [Aspergillus nidulans FGSC A4]|uniref:Uncharacterized protein n=1 Tax=Emericella nidulans (strain FGSC A4 / ATCC 38163 / CBS 112.46 / NRRL 194 / M139) TaxID=227321 RepID=Q5AYZ8_EMENI|nr:hypothetical protein [Aspergillus nidulans FGSC A4]EAA58504.1 predicted protein [Aspergillus nidulans FGSC A4]CBF69368.1 TPA: conserved hypothetical protein [Aspergillus nidulans FGSC A4]|eukprot:XP_664086.1 predicted protein [Aspergillus nidulans FGSC A4]